MKLITFRKNDQENEERIYSNIVTTKLHVCKAENI